MSHPCLRRWTFNFGALALNASALVAQGIEAPAETELEPGCTFRIFEVGHSLERVLEPIVDQSPNLDERRAQINAPGDDEFGGFVDYFVVEVSAWLRVEQPGEYVFRTRSDDGSWLELDDELVLWHSGLHGPDPRDGYETLEPGLRRLRLLMFENEGGAYLSLEWKPPGATEFELIPEEALRTEKGVTRVVSPGPKKFKSELGDLSAGDGLALEEAHPGWRIESLRPADFEPKVGGLGWLPDGRLGVATFDPKNNGERQLEPNGTLWALSNLDAGDPNAIVVNEIATDFVHPLGLVSIGPWVYVAERASITRLRDADGDGTLETREVFASGWESDNYHHFTFGPELEVDADGEPRYLHASLSTSIGTEEEFGGGSIAGSNGPNPENRGTWLRISLDEALSPEQRVEYLAGGFRTPNGILPLGDGSALIADNQGAWKPASRIDHARAGKFYGHYNETRVTTERYPNGGAAALFADQPPTPPAIWLPQGEASNSPTDMLRLEAGPFAGQVLFGELKLGGLRRACFETVDDVLQGSVFRFCQGFEGGVNRLLPAPDGSIIVGMTGEQATWSWRETTIGLQRMVPTGGGAFEFHSVHATSDGLRLRFTERVDPDAAADLDNYTARQWRYRASPEYGGSKLDDEALEVTAAVLGDDGFEVELTIPGMRKERCVHLRAMLKSSRGESIWSPECWTTLNRIPGRAHPDPLPREQCGVLIFSKTAGYRHESIPDGVRCIEELCAGLELSSYATEDASIFEDTSLARFHTAVFLSTTGDVLDLAQEAAFQRWITAGGSFLGIHAAADTEYDWPFYARVVGARFDSHPAIQTARVQVVDGSHACTQHLPEIWSRTDEWYDFRALPNESFRVLLELDDTSYEGASTTARCGSHPIAWCREDGASRFLYTGGGHTSEAFEETEFRTHLKGALRWVAVR